MRLDQWLISFEKKNLRNVLSVHLYPQPFLEKSALIIFVYLQNMHLK